MSFLGSPVLGWGTEVSCPRTFPRKNCEDPVRLEPRTPGLRFKHFTTELRAFIVSGVKLLETKHVELCKGLTLAEKSFRQHFQEKTGYLTFAT